MNDEQAARVATELFHHADPGLTAPADRLESVARRAAQRARVRSTVAVVVALFCGIAGATAFGALRPAGTTANPASPVISSTAPTTPSPTTTAAGLVLGEYVQLPISKVRVFRPNGYTIVEGMSGGTAVIDISNEPLSAAACASRQVCSTATAVESHQILVRLFPGRVEQTAFKQVSLWCHGGNPIPQLNPPTLTTRSLPQTMCAGASASFDLGLLDLVLSAQAPTAAVG